MNTSTPVKVRLFTYKSFRHYGGREIITTPHICKAEFLADQIDTIVVRLLEPCAGFNTGHKISVQPKDYDI